MIKDSYFIIGVMSGTSLDGLDLCYVKFQFDKNWNFEIIRSETISYDDNWIQKLNMETFYRFISFIKARRFLRVDFALKDFSLCQRDSLKLGTTNERI